MGFWTCTLVGTKPAFGSFVIPHNSLSKNTDWESGDYFCLSVPCIERNSMRYTYKIMTFDLYPNDGDKQ